jgi:hypothetical protein
MTVCDITDSYFDSKEGYVLTTSEVVTNPSYWEYGLTHQWDFMHKIDLESESFVRVIKKKRNQNSIYMAHWGGR